MAVAWAQTLTDNHQEAINTFIEGYASDAKRAKAFHKAFLDERGMIQRTGWLESLVNGNSSWRGELCPWFNYGVIRFLSERVHSHMHVFEYGAGFSTLWWQRRVASITAVEHDERWAARIMELVSLPTVVKHIELLYDGAYCRAIIETGNTYDVVVVDGRDRVNCMKSSIRTLTPEGVIIFDNSQRAYYRPDIDELKSTGFKEIQFSGLAPMTHVESFASVLYRAANCLGI